MDDFAIIRAKIAEKAKENNLELTDKADAVALIRSFISLRMASIASTFPETIVNLVLALITPSINSSKAARDIPPPRLPAHLGRRQDRFFANRQHNHQD